MSDQNVSETDAKKDEKTNAQDASVDSKETWKDGNEFDAKKAQDLIEKLRGEVRELKPKAKKAEDYEKQEKDKKDAELPEIERFKTKAQELEAENKKIKLDLLKQQTASKLGLPDVLANRLQGETPEEIEADAKQLLETLPKKANTASATNPGGDRQVAETDAERRRRLGI